jgi:hypothetical protein
MKVPAAAFKSALHEIKREREGCMCYGWARETRKENQTNAALEREREHI